MFDYEAFSERIAELIGIDVQPPLNPYDGLYTDLGLDSLQAFELIIIIETLADAVPLDDVPELYTMQDAFEYYAHLSRESAAAPWPG